MISRRRIEIGKENQRQQEHFDVAKFNMVLLDEPQFAVQDRMWAKMSPTANSVNQSGGDAWRSNRYWKSVSRPCEYFGGVSCVLVPLGELQSPV